MIDRWVINVKYQHGKTTKKNCRNNSTGYAKTLNTECNKLGCQLFHPPVCLINMLHVAKCILCFRWFHQENAEYCCVLQNIGPTLLHHSTSVARFTSNECVGGCRATRPCQLPSQCFKQNCRFLWELIYGIKRNYKSLVIIIINIMIVLSFIRLLGYYGGLRRRGAETL